MPRIHERAKSIIGEKWPLIGMAALSAFYFAIVLISSPQLSPAYDEPIHVSSGLSFLTRENYVDKQAAWWTAVDPLTPPMDALSGAFAWMSGQSPDYRIKPLTPFKHVLAARWANHLIGWLALILVYFWAGRIWSSGGGLIAAALLALNPLFLGHSTIVSTDLYAAFGGLLAACALWKIFLDRSNSFNPSPKEEMISFLALAFILAFAILCKVSNLIFLVIAPAVALAAQLLQRRPDSDNSFNEDERHGFSFRPLLIAIAASALALILAAAVYEYGRPHAAPVQIAAGKIALPFGQGLLEAAATMRHLAVAHPRVFFWGVIESPSPKHFAGAFLIKTPLPLIMLYVLTPMACAIRLRKSREAEASIFFLALLIVIFTAIVAFSGVYIGLRHMLLPISLLCVLGGGLATAPRLLAEERAEGGEDEGVEMREPTARMQPITAIGLICFTWAAVETGRSTPWHATYMNPIGRREMSLVDADGDWGQGLIALRKWQDRYSPSQPIFLSYFGNNRPEDFGVRYRGLPAPYSWAYPDPAVGYAADPGKLNGYVAISATHLAGIYMDAARLPLDFYAPWRNRSPDHVIGGGSIYIYDNRIKTSSR